MMEILKIVNCSFNEFLNAFMTILYLLMEILKL